MKNFTNTALKLCNYWSIVSSVFFLIILIIGNIFFIKDSMTYNKIDSTVTSIQNNSCETKQRTVIDNHRYFSSQHTEEYSDCYLVVKYEIDNKVYSGKIHTEDINHSVNDKITIEYNKNNIKDIREYKSTKKIFMYVLIIFLLLTITNLYVRIYYSKNNLVKAFIGITCLQNIFSSRY
tara:strand:+ start:735 stop:1268 length:534 start_codon:yes stop_codon:yes gene_type:complete